MDLYRSKHSDKKYSNRNSSSNDRPSRSFRNSNFKIETEVQDIPETTEVQDIPETTEVQEIPEIMTVKIQL